MGSPLFTSTARLSKPLIYLLTGVAALQVFILVLFGVMSGDAPDLMGIVIPTFVLLLIVPMLFATTRLSIDNAEVHVKTFGIFSTTIARNDIVDARVGTPTGIGAGAGLRIMGTMKTGYLTGGPNLEIETADGAVVVSTPHPEKAVSALGFVPATASQKN